jgi:hypothetical protein
VHLVSYRYAKEAVKMKSMLLIAFGLVSLFSAGIAATQESPEAPVDLLDLFNQLLAFLNTVANWIGYGILSLIQRLLPSVTLSPGLASAVGQLTTLTVLFLIARSSRRFAWIIIIVAWALLAMRFVIELVQSLLK